MNAAFNVWKPITPSNTLDLDALTDSLWVGGGGDVAAVQQNNVVQVFPAVPAGSWLPLKARRINATGTTATGLVALYEV
jgi:hypothetical protein